MIFNSLQISDANSSTSSASKFKGSLSHFSFYLSHLPSCTYLPRRQAQPKRVLHHPLKLSFSLFAFLSLTSPADKRSPSPPAELSSSLCRSLSHSPSPLTIRFSIFDFSIRQLYCNSVRNARWTQGVLLSIWGVHGNYERMALKRLGF